MMSTTIWHPDFCWPRWSAEFGGRQGIPSRTIPESLAAWVLLPFLTVRPPARRRERCSTNPDRNLSGGDSSRQRVVVGPVIRRLPSQTFRPRTLAELFDGRSHNGIKSPRPGRKTDRPSKVHDAWPTDFFGRRFLSSAVRPALVRTKRSGRAGILAFHLPHLPFWCQADLLRRRIVQ